MAVKGDKSSLPKRIAVSAAFLIMAVACSDNTSIESWDFEDRADAEVDVADSGETDDPAECLIPPDYPEASEYLCHHDVLGEEWCSNGKSHRCVEPVDGIPASGFFPSERFSTTCCEIAHPDVEMTLESVQADSSAGFFRAEVVLANHGNRSGEVRCELATIEIEADELDCSPGGPSLLYVDARPIGEPIMLAAGASVELELTKDFERPNEDFPPGFILECKARGEPFPALTYCYRANCRDGEFVDEGCSTANSIQFLETQVGQLP